MKKVPMRTCVVTKEKLPKKDLIRIVKTEDGYIVDETGKVNGHGCYIKRDVEVITKAKEKHALDHAFEDKIKDELYDEIINKIN